MILTLSNLLLLMIIIMIIMAVRIKRKKLNVLWPINILKFLLPFFSYVFFSQSFLLFMTAIICVDNQSFINPYIECHSIFILKMLIPFAAQGIALQVIIGIITNILYFKLVFIKPGSDVLKKTNTSPDVVFIISKIGLNILFSLDMKTEREQWIILFLIIIFTGMNAYYNLYFQNRVNTILNLLNNFFSLATFSGFLCLFISKIFYKIEFNGSLYLLFVFIIIIFVYLLFYKNKDINYVLIDYKEINEPLDYLYYISKFYNIIYNKKNSRKYYIIVESIISKIEENCIIPDCPLEKYIENIKKGNEYPFLLNQFLEILFRYGISKFSNDICLKNNYILFLITTMNYQKKALRILNNIQNKSFSFQNKYNIYRILKLIEKNGISLDNKNNSIVEYRKNIQDFKTLIKQIVLSYYKFYSLLLGSKYQNSNSFNKMHKIGIEIMKENPKLDYLYNKLMIVKADNIEIIRLYSEFVEGILYNDELLEKCYNNSKLTYKKMEIHEKKFSEFNIGLLNEKQNVTFLIVSAQKEQLGKIISFSMNISKIFGYKKEELLGKHINIIIPKLLHKSHDLTMIEECEKSKFKLFDYLNLKKAYFPDFIKKTVYGISKLKFLIELKLNIYFIKTEDNKLLYIIEILNSDPLMMDLIKNINNDLKFCVLTDDNFLIQSFTSNCLELLKLDYSFINSNISIINFIKQFQDDYLNALNTTAMTRYTSSAYKTELSEEKYLDIKIIRNNIPSKIKKTIKNDLFIKKYSKKCKITWKINDKNNIKKSIVKNKSIYFPENDCKSNIFDISQIAENGINMYMEIEKIIMKNQIVGYYFYFSKTNKKSINNMSYILENDISNDNNNFFVKLRKYQCKFDSKISSIISEEVHDLKKNSSLRINKNDNNEVKKDIKTIHQNKKEVNYSLISKTLPFDFNKVDNFVITGDFVPNDTSNFVLDLEKFYFVQHFENKETHDFINILKNEANNKIKIQQEQLNLLLKDSREESEESEELESEENSEMQDDSSYANSSNLEPIKYNIKKPRKSLADSEKNELSKKNVPKVSNKIVQQYENINNNDLNSNINKKKLINKNSIVSKYYKVNLSKIHFTIFNFDKEMIAEGDKEEKECKIEKIMENIKNHNGSIYLEKDDKFSYLSLFKIKKNINKENNNNTIKNINNEFNYQIDEEKILKMKLYEALNKQKDEPPIIKLKINSTLSFIVMVIVGIIILIIHLDFLSTIKTTLALIKDTIIIKYCSQISTYYLRELTLLNFNAEEIKGGIYENFPDKDQDDYQQLILSELNKLFVESQSSLKNLYSTSISLPKQSATLFSEFNITIKISKNPIFDINCNIITSLMQYTCAFQNLASSTHIINQNHTDIYNFIYNNLYGYKTILNLLIQIYSSELNATSNLILVISIVSSNIIFIIFIVFFAILVKYYLSSIRSRSNYMNVFYGINENILKNLANNCENLINRLKTSEEQKYYEEDNLEQSINHNNINSDKNQKSNQKQAFSKQKDLNYDIDNEQKIVKASNTGRRFIIIYGIVSFMNNTYFIFISIYMIILSKKALFLFNFCNKLQNYQLEIINTFNIYREFLFDDKSKINDLTAFEYLIKAEKENYYQLNNDIKYIKSNEAQFFPKNQKNLCSYYKNNYFSSSSQCAEKIGIITEYDFDTLSNYFIEEIKIDKNIVIYMLKNEKIVGNLTDYNKEDYINDIDIPKIDGQSENNNLFRLDLFNNDTIHNYLNIIFFSIILPYIDENRKIIPNIMSLGKVENFIIWANIVYESLLIIMFFFYFLPVISYINNVIYKTKNMLSIIPLSILVSQKGVSTMLNIS